MSDDIDIEEHDILDNPHIKNIFPDLSVVKKEISEYFNEALPVKQEPELSKSPQLVLSNKPSINDKKINETIEDKNVQKQTKSSSIENSLTGSVKILKTNISFQKNKIIIGSKPNKAVVKNGSDSRENNRIRCPKVFLHDVRTNLEKSERYCKECRILFAEKRKLTEHYVKKHSTPRRQILTRTRINTNNTVDENFVPAIKRKRSDENDIKSVTKLDTSKSVKNNRDKPLTRMDSSNELDEIIKSFTRSGSSKTKTNEHVQPSTSSDTSSNDEDEDLPATEFNISDSSEENETVVESLTKLDANQCRICDIRVANRGNLVRHYRAIHHKKLTFQSTKTTDKSKGNSFDKYGNVSRNRSNNNDIKSVTKLDTPKSVAKNSDKPLTRMDTSNEWDENIKSFTRSGSSKTKTIENVKPSTSSDTSSNDEDESLPAAEFNISDSSENETVAESHTKLDVNRCRICDIRVANRGNLVRHYRAIHRKKLTFKSSKTTDNSKGKSSDKYGNKSKDARDSSNRCMTCNTRFSSISSLNRHMKIHVHQSNIEASPSKIKTDQRIKARELVNKNRTKMSNVENKKCFHCKRQFPDSKSLIEHVYQILKSKRTRNSDRIAIKVKQTECNVASNKNRLTAKNEPINKNACHPTKLKNNNNGLNTNKKHLGKRNVTRIKNKLRPTKINNVAIKNNKKENKTKDILYVCQHCTYCFLTIKNYIQHMIKRHGTKVSKINRQPFDPQCKYCSSNNSSVLYHNRHLYKEHLDVIEKKITNRNIKVSESGDSVKVKVENSKAFAFKSELFKCGRCDIHFVSSETAKDHMGHMEFLINWKCSICDLIFKKTDEKMHLLQHLSSDYIAVNEFSSEALSSLLYNCTKCAIHFSEIKYIEHYEKCEKETAISTYCKACDILINEADANIHNTNHSQNEDFSPNVITSDIIFDNKSNSVNKSGSKSRKKIRKPITRNGKLAVNHNMANVTFTPCSTCQCFMTLVKEIHLKKQCSQMVKHVCVDCGLLLTNKSIDTHRKYHKMKNLTLQDFIFTDLSGNIIKPPIPEYPQCKICKVHFVNKLGIISHVCSEFTDISSCDICKIKLSNTAFKLHMAYHNYCLKDEQVKTNIKTPSSVKKQKVVSKDVDAAKDTTIATNTAATASKEKSSTQDFNKAQNLSIIKIEPNIAILFSCKSCFITLTTYDKLIEHCQKHPTAEEAQSLYLKSCNVCNLKFDFPTYEIHNEIHTNDLSLKNFAVDIKYFSFDKKIWLNHVFQTLNPNQINEIIGRSIYQNEHRVRFKMLQSGPHNLTIYKCAKCNLFFDHKDVFRHVKCLTLNVRGTPCATCGLKFLSGALRNQHIKIHLAHPKINDKSYRILLFNEASDEVNSNVAAQPSQYIIYQCRNCNGVIEKSANHQCSIKDLKKCNDCGLLIYKENFKSHALKHKNLTNFDPDSIKVILLGAKEAKTDSETLVLHPSFKGLIYDYTLYQCKRCEICVKNDLYISSHVCVFGINRCQCPKCDFFFNSKGYNHHLKTHNVDPNFEKDNINIIQFDLKPDSDVEVKTKDDKELEHKVKVESANTVTLYKCKCGLHFVDRCKVIQHIKQCNPKCKTYKQNCTKCGLLFNPSELFSHLVSHHGNKNQPNKYDVKEISEENLEQLKVILFNCSKCGLHFYDKIVANDHFKLCKGEIGEFEECTKCKIIYDKSSFVLDEHNENCENMFEIEIIDESNIEDTANVDLNKKCENVANEH